MSAGCTMPSQATLDRLAPEMAEIGVERLGAGHGQEHEPHDDEADHAVRQDELDAEHRVEGQEDARIVDDVDEAAGRERGEPHEHDRPEELRHLRRPVRLHDEQQHQDRDRDRQTTMCSSCGATSFRPSTADSTEMAGVSTASP